MEARLVLDASISEAAEIRAILRGASGEVVVRPNTPVVPLESMPASASFVHPSAEILQGAKITVRQQDYVTPYVALDARGGDIRVGSSSTIQDVTVGSGAITPASIERTSNPAKPQRPPAGWTWEWKSSEIPVDGCSFWR